jgi:HemY protein
MRSVFLLALIALLLGVGLVAMIESEPGYLLIAFGDYTVESSLWVGLLLIAVLVLVLYAVVGTIARLLASPGSVRFWATGRQRRQAARLTNRGLISYIEGDWRKSRRALQRGAKHSASPVFNHLMAARASFQLDDPEQMRSDLEAALREDVQSAVAVDLTQAELALQGGKFDRALTCLERVAQRSNSPQVSRLRCKALLGLGDWEGLAELLPVLRRQGALPDKELARLERECHLRLLEGAALDLGEDTVAALKLTWRRVPPALQQDEALLHRYVELLEKVGAGDDAAKLITRTLKKRWDPALVNRYGRLALPKSRRQLTQAEQWLGKHGDDPELFLCLGRLAARQQDWQRARQYFERSIQAGPTEEACAELGRLLLASGETSLAAQYFNTGITLQGESLPELPLPDVVGGEDLVPEDRRLDGERVEEEKD